ncbi:MULTISPECIES: arginase family protein [Gammaproteobacteria]|uniref:arginase family protein n=1 Tax=Gammaproteobacteria TaxID=1236 RepID=UPI000DCFD52A|nr:MULTISPECIES: arginase family protein [Gammaproteobacteria]RTE85903.1 arginase [Aliidiomarina sp. B3213]TCZ90097.1 arginase [Lysobacter sp. N42]
MYEFVQAVDPQEWVKPRDNETKVGQAVPLLPKAESYSAALASAYSAGQRVAILGVPECIGPRANLGNGGAQDGWNAFLKSFLNLQSTHALPLQDLLLVGNVDTTDLMLEAEQLDVSKPHELLRLRELVALLDTRVQHVVAPLFNAGFEVVLVGGGHNNAYPLLTSLHQAVGVPVGAINLDPHSDFRPREGRHSGNGFSYAYTEGALGYYHVMSLHEGKNSATTLKNLADAGFRYHSIHHLYDMQFTDAMRDVTAKAIAWQAPLGVEVDVDAIQFAPASAYNTTGVSVAQAYSFVSDLASLPEAKYLHLAEAAPSCHPAGIDAGMQHAGQLLSELLIAWLRGRGRRASEPLR